MTAHTAGPFELDRIDLKILEALQSDGRITNRDLAEKVALSPSACLARVKQLESVGLITGYHAILDLELIRPVMVVYAQVTMQRHLIDWFDKFDAVLRSVPEVVEAARVSGPFDYILKIVVTDMREFRQLAAELLTESNGVEKMVTHVLVQEAKRFSGYPLRSSRMIKRTY
jgi:DNA-binding Lrp family transcriptional regulator